MMTHCRFDALQARVRTLAMVLTLAFLLACFENSEAQDPLIASAKADGEQVANATSIDRLLEKYEQRGREQWESHIQDLEQKNAIEKHANNAVLFFGSSSFRLWKTMKDDMAPYSVINRGYGGAKFVDMVVFADRMLSPHQYGALMLFAANDVKGEATDSSPEEVECALREIIRVSRAHQPDAPVFVVEVTPTEKRFKSWDRTRRINTAIREVALTTENCWCITTAESFLTTDVKPRPEFFVEDKLHLNRRGYLRWARLIKSSLDEFSSINLTGNSD